MYFGMPFSTPFGNPEDVVLVVQPPFDIDGNGTRIRVCMAAGYAQFGRLVIDGVAQGSPQYISDSTTITSTYPGYTEFKGLYDTIETKHSVQIMPMGDWSSPIIDTTPMSVFFQKTRSPQFNVSWAPVTEIFSYGDAAQFSSWSFIGLSRFVNCKPNIYRPSWGALEIVLTTVAGVHTLSLQKNGVEMATGSRTGNGSITLTASNSSGLSGSVTIAYTADIAVGSAATVAVRFPASYAVHYKTTPFIGGDFPRVAEATFLDPGLDTSPFTYTSPLLGGTTYYVVIHQVDDAGNEGTGLQGGGAIVTVSQPPAPPTAFTYTTGVPDMQIRFISSATVGATYNQYDSLATGILNMNSATFTYPAQPASTPQAVNQTALFGFTGYRYIILRSVSGGIEEGNNNILQIQYVAGVLVLQRPNFPSVSGAVTVSGLSVTIPYSVQAVDSAATPAMIAVYIQTADPTVTPFTYVTPNNTGVIPAQSGNSYVGSVIATAGGSNPYYIALKTIAADGTKSINTDYFGPIQLEAVVPTDPSNIVVIQGA